MCVEQLTLPPLKSETSGTRCGLPLLPPLYYLDKILCLLGEPYTVVGHDLEGDVDLLVTGPVSDYQTLNGSDRGTRACD